MTCCHLVASVSTTEGGWPPFVHRFSSGQSLSRVRLFATLWIAARQAFLPVTNCSLLKLVSIESVMPSHPLSSPSPPAFNLSQHQGLFQESVPFIRWPKYWSFSFSISPSNEYSGLISFRMTWFGLLAVQRTLKSLPQHHSSKASILQRSAFFIVQLSHPSSSKLFGKPVTCASPVSPLTV